VPHWLSGKLIQEFTIFVPQCQSNDSFGDGATHVRLRIFDYIRSEALSHGRSNSDVSMALWIEMADVL
jgi:hypothetical protein